MKFTTILDEGRMELSARPPRKGKKGRKPRSEAEKLLDAFVSFKDEILRFAKRREVPFSNNQAYADIGIVQPNATSAWQKCGRKSQAPIETPITPKPAAEFQAACSRCHYQGCSSLAALQNVLNGNTMAIFGQSKSNLINPSFQQFAFPY